MTAPRPASARTEPPLARAELAGFEAKLRDAESLTERARILRALGERLAQFDRSRRP